MTRSRTIARSILAACLLAGAGCGPNAREALQNNFSQDPPVSVEYQPDGSTLYKTRNIVLYADYARSELTSLVMLIALPGKTAASDPLPSTDGLVKFRSISKVPNFEAHRNLGLTLDGQQLDLGPCAYEQETPAEGKTIENLTAVIPREIVNAMAAAEEVQGVIGEVPFGLTGPELEPVRALVDSIGHLAY